MWAKMRAAPPDPTWTTSQACRMLQPLACHPGEEGQVPGGPVTGAEDQEPMFRMCAAQREKACVSRVQYRFVDYATLSYLTVVAVLVFAFGRGRTALWPYFVLAHAACALAIHLIIVAHARVPGSLVVDLLRHLYPILLYTPLYCETGMLNQMFVTGYLDEFLMRLDERLFGFQPWVALMDWFPCVAVSETLYLAYFLYYVMIAGVGVAFYVRDKSRLFHYVSVVSFVFYSCYLVFIFLPVAGPSVFWMEEGQFLLDNGLPQLSLTFPSEVRCGPFFQIMLFIYAHFETPGAAFPSSHVAVAICTLWFTWRYLPRVRLVHLAAVALLCVATVYCRYHYAVDTLAGAAAGVILTGFGEFLHGRFVPLEDRAGPRRSELGCGG